MRKLNLWLFFCSLKCNAYNLCVFFRKQSANPTKAGRLICRTHELPHPLWQPMLSCVATVIFPRNHFRNFPPKGVYLQWNNASSKPCFRTLSIIWKCFQQRNREEFSVTAMQKVFSANFAKMSTTENLHLPIYQTEQTPFCVCHMNVQSWKFLPFDVGDTK